MLSRGGERTCTSGHPETMWQSGLNQFAAEIIGWGSRRACGPCQCVKKTSILFENKVNDQDGRMQLAHSHIKSDTVALKNYSGMGFTLM